MEVPEIDIDTFAERVDAGATVIDVREIDEYEDGHVPGATWIPLGDVPDRVGDVPSDREVLVICKSGGRSLRASEFLREHGVDAVNVRGGTMAWIDSGRSVVEGDQPG